MSSLTEMKPIRDVVIAVVISLCVVSASFGQFNPDAGQWGKDDPTHVRVMTWNMKDGICSTNIKTAARPNWAGIVRIIADLQPDVILMQETGGNAGNGTGTGLDSAANLVTTIGLLIRGGADPFNGGNVGIYVQQFAPDFDLPYVFASGDADGFNRNIIVSRWPFADLNNSGFSTMSNFTILSTGTYAPGGNGGIRGFMTAEIDLPDDVYAGDLVVGNSHLKCCGTTSDRAERLQAAQNIAYFIDYYFNGAGTGMVDPLSRVFLPVINRASMNVLDENTPVIWGGDWNEDENTNNRRGPALWMTQAAIEGGTDGTDRDRSDSMFDDARDIFIPTSRTTFGSTSSGSKLDYIAWQDSIATMHRSFIFNTSTIGLFGRPYPPAVNASASSSSVSGQASDHRPVVVDFILPLADVAPTCPCDADGSGEVNIGDYFAFLSLFFTQLGESGSADINGDGVVAVDDYFLFLNCFFQFLNQSC